MIFSFVSGLLRLAMVILVILACLKYLSKK